MLQRETQCAVDIAGQLPESETVRAWLDAARSTEDREQVIDELLQSEAFVDFWTLKFGDLLLISGRRGSSIFSALAPYGVET